VAHTTRATTETADEPDHGDQAWSHHLRTPLTSIVGYLELLLDGDAGSLGATQVEMLRIVRRNALRLQDVTEALERHLSDQAPTGAIADTTA
jgi:signal transduction histidine kinase